MTLFVVCLSEVPEIVKRAREIAGETAESLDWGYRISSAIKQGLTTSDNYNETALVRNIIDDFYAAGILREPPKLPTAQELREVAAKRMEHTEKNVIACAVRKADGDSYCYRAIEAVIDYLYSLGLIEPTKTIPVPLTEQDAIDALKRRDLETIKKYLDQGETNDAK